MGRVILIEGRASSKYCSEKEFCPTDLDDLRADWEQKEVTPFVYTGYDIIYQVCNTRGIGVNIGKNESHIWGLSCGDSLTTFYRAMRLVESLPIYNNRTLANCFDIARGEKGARNIMMTIIDSIGKNGLKEILNCELPFSPNEIRDIIVTKFREREQCFIDEMAKETRKRLDDYLKYYQENIVRERKSNK